MNLLIVIYIVIFSLLFSLVVLWLTTIGYIVKDKKREKQYLRLEQGIIESLAYSFIDDSIDKTENIKKLKTYIKDNDISFWDSVNVFMKVNRFIKFSNNENLKFIFNSLGLEKVLKEKITTNDWYVKAKAIWMTYEFGISDNTKLIIPYRNDDITLIRRESQIALVTFLGWKSLILLPYFTKTMSLWQQIRIIEKLHETEEKLDIYHFEKALKSENIIVKELLVRIIKSFKLHEYKYYVVKQLYSKNNHLIKVAVEALNELTPESIELKQIEKRLPNIQRELVRNYLHVS